MTRLPDIHRHLAAEVRAKMEGHNVRWDDAAGCFIVKSDTRDGVTYRLRVSAVVTASRRFVPLVVSCDCPAGIHAAQRPAGLATCKHAARVLQRLERERLARWDGTQNRFIARGALRDAALEEHDQRLPRDDPPVTVEGPRRASRRPRPAEGDDLAKQIRASL